MNLDPPGAAPDPPARAAAKPELFQTRRDFLRGLGLGAAACYLLPPRLFSASASLAGEGPARFGVNAHYGSARAPLVRTPYVALPLGAISARGWLLKQLELQRDGLTGHADELPEWLPALRNSAWQGGTGDAWERGPYYLKGLVPLAFSLQDEGLKKKVQAWLDPILASQKEDGSFGPARNADWWPRMLVTYALRDYHEATSDPRVPPFLTNYYAYMAKELPQRPLDKWGKARGADEIETILWLYDRTGNPALISLALLLREQVYDWTAAFADNGFYTADPPGPGVDHTMLNHNVNTCQAVKTPAVLHRLTGQPEGTAAFARTDHYLSHDHGLVLGISSGSEELAGRSPSQAVETCSIVEQMLSDETNLRVLGDAQWGDHLERIAFNALPAALSDDIHQHVYYTRPNHPAARLGQSGFIEDSDDRFTPGPRSGYPCCCYNFHLGWPKYVQNSWGATHDNGLAVLAYGPAQVTAKVGDGGTLVTVVQDTDYPFHDTIHLKLRTPAPVRFPLELRVPAWCAAPRITVGGEAVANVRPGTFARIDRQWKNGDEVVATFPMELRAPVGFLQTVSLEHGPLIYSLRIEAQKKILQPDPRGFDQFELSPGSAWNYALEIDPANPAASVQVKEAPMPGNPFVAAETPVQLTARARRLPEWTFARNGWEADEPPYGPVATSEAPETIQLVPFGAQFLRITQFPYIGEPVAPPRSFADRFEDDTFAARWGIYGNGWYRQNGHLCCRSKKASKTIAVGLTFTDFTYDSQVSVPARGDAGLLFRVAKPGFGDLEFNGYYVGLSAQDKAVLLGKSNGTWTEIKRVPFAIQPDQAYPVRIVTAGAKISVFVQDTATPMLEAEDGDHGSGSIGVRTATKKFAIPRFGPILVQAA